MVHELTVEYVRDDRQHWILFFIIQDPAKVSLLTAVEVGAVTKTESITAEQATAVERGQQEPRQHSHRCI